MEGVFIDKGGAVVNVKHSDFAPTGGSPAQGNGVADDTAALQKAIDYAEAQFDATRRTGRHQASDDDYYGVTLYFPPGRYRLTGKLMLTRPLRLLGAGYNESILVTEVNQPVLHFHPGVTKTTMVRARIERLGFEGNYVYRTANTAVAAQDGIYLTKRPNDDKGTTTPTDDIIYSNTLVEVEACQFYGLGGAGIHGDFAETGTAHAAGDKFSIHGCHIEGCGGYGIRLDRRHATAYIVRNHITRNAGGIALLGTQQFPVSSSRILDNIIEANDGGPNGAGVGAGSAQKPFVGVRLEWVNFCEIRGNYFEWHVNSVYVEGNCRNIVVARNWFDGNDVTLPKRHYEASGGSLITRRLSPVHVENYAIGVVIEENDCYIPRMPDGDAGSLATWSPAPNNWGTQYEVFSTLGGSQHELIRNSARLAGGRREDVTYQAGAGDRILFEGLRYITTQGLEVEHRERTYRRLIETGERLHLTAGSLLAQKAARFEHEGVASDGVYHDYVYPAGLGDTIRARGVLYQRNTDGSLTQKSALWLYTDQGFTFPLHGWNALGTEYGSRRIDFAGQSPVAAGDVSFWMRGSIRFNQAPSVLGASGQQYTLLGWRCVADGYPGTWVEMRTPTGT